LEVNTRIKKIEEEKLLSLQSVSNDLRETRHHFESALENAAACKTKQMLDFLDAVDAEEAKLDDVLAEGLAYKVDVSTKFNVQLDVEEVCMQLANSLNGEVVLPDEESRGIFRPAVALAPPRRGKDTAKERRKIESTEDVMTVLDDLNTQLARMHKEKERAVSGEQWTDASAIVAEIAQVETEIEKLEKDLLSAKKIEAVQTQERELLAITLQETLANLHARKERLLQRSPIDYHEVATIADEIEAVQKEIAENNVEVLIKSEPSVAAPRQSKSKELREYEQVMMKERTGGGGLFSFMF